MDCAEEIGCENNISIESVHQDFKDWRHNKTTNRIPENLWDKVFLLLTHTDMSPGIMPNSFCSFLMLSLACSRELCSQTMK
jgi:hypothetical protein